MPRTFLALFWVAVMIGIAVLASRGDIPSDDAWRLLILTPALALATLGGKPCCGVLRRFRA